MSEPNQQTAQLEGNEPKATTYTVLRQSGNDKHVWVWQANKEARSAEAAIRAAAVDLNENETKEEAATFVAIPESSWKPRAVSVVVDRKVVLA
jgi:hypothetical protein